MFRCSMRARSLEAKVAYARIHQGAQQGSQCNMTYIDFSNLGRTSDQIFVRFVLLRFGLLFFIHVVKFPTLFKVALLSVG